MSVDQTERLVFLPISEHEVQIIDSCQACGSKDLHQFLDFGPMPIPNIYLSPEDVRKHGQITFQLDANLCTECGLVQLGEIVPSEALFAANYAYRTPDAMRADFRESVHETIQISGAKPGSKVLEIGSNVGICLDEYQKEGFVVLGVDPAAVYAQQANAAGIETIIESFTIPLADQIASERGKVDIVTAANVLQHIPDLVGTLEGIRRVLTPNGVFTLEFPYLGNILDNTDFDTFYAEHYYYLSLTPLQILLDKLGMVIVHAKKLPDVHCGSMRIFVRHKPAEIGKEVLAMLQEEEEKGFRNPQRYEEFARNVDDVVNEIHQHLHVAKRRGDNIGAHGSSAKFVTLTNYAHVGPNQIPWVADTTQAKHGRFTPGMAIPVVPEEKLFEEAPDLIFSGIRNFHEQNAFKYRKIRERNPRSRVLIPIPRVVYK